MVSKTNWKGATIKRAEHTSDYFCMHRKTAQDNRLSFEARGMMAYLLSKPDDWTIKVDDLVKQNSSKGRVYKILNELITFGYLDKRERTQDAQGRWHWSPYVLHEISTLNIIPYPENHDMENHSMENAEIKEQSTEIESTERNTIAPSAGAPQVPDSPAEEIIPVVESKHEKLSSEDHAEFIAILGKDFNLNGGRVFDVYHQLRGSIAAKNKSTKRYECGALFRDKPVDLKELIGFVKYYRAKCVGADLPISADGVEDWFGKYRKAQAVQENKPLSLFQRKLPANIDMLDVRGKPA